MKRLIIILIFLTSGLKGQDNPMFDSVDYFVRNKIKNVHWHLSEWYYSPPWNYFKSTFDAKTNTLNGKSFVLRDTIIARKPENNLYNDTIRYSFDKNNRLIRKTVTTGYPAVYKGPFKTTTSYIYTDSSSKKLSKIITESPYYIDVRNFYYTQSLLSIRTSLDSNKLDHKIHFETTSYDYYPDRKLKKETRRVTSDNCPTICEGTIEFKYDTGFKNDSTPMPGIPFVPLITIKNNKKTEIYAYVWAYPDRGNKDRNSDRFSSDIKADSTYEIAFDPRDDRKHIIQIKKQWSPIIRKEEYTGFEIIVYSNPNPDKNKSFDPSKAEVIFTEKVSIESLFEKPKTIKIK